MIDYLNPPPLGKTALTPNSSPEDVLGVVEILTLITDPAAHKKRLDELNSAVQEANRKIEEGKAATEKRRTAESMFAEAAKIMQERKVAAAKLDARAGDLDRRERDLIDREGKLGQQMRNHEISHKAREDGLDVWERELRAREGIYEAKAKKLAEDRAEVDRRSAVLSEIKSKI